MFKDEKELASRSNLFGGFSQYLIESLINKIMFATSKVTLLIFLRFRCEKKAAFNFFFLFARVNDGL